MLRLLSLSLSVVLISYASIAQAADRYWIDPAGGTFTDTGNWSATFGGPGGASVPTATDLTIYRNNGTYTVSYPGRGIIDPPLTYQTGLVLADGGTVTFADGGGLNKLPATVSATQLILTRAGVPSPTTLTTTLTDFRANSLSIASNSNANNTFNVNAGTFTIEGSMTAISIAEGPGATGTLNVNNGADVVVNGTTPFVYIGKSSSATSQANVNVTGAGSTLTVNNSGWIIIGDHTTSASDPAATGNLSITAGGSVASSLVELGASSGATGNLTVSGAGSTLSAPAFRVGRSGTGTFNLNSGGLVTSNSSLIGVNGTGTANVTGAGSAWNATTLSIGDREIGSLNITGQGNVTTVDSTVGTGSGSNGTAVVDGIGSQFNITGTLNVGASGNGALTVRNGASLSSADASIGRHQFGVGTLTVDGLGAVGAWMNTGILTIGDLSQGTLNVTHAGLVTSQAATLGSTSGSTGTATIDGIGSTWNCNGLLTLGLQGAATLNIIGGGKLNSSTTVVGQTATGAGTINIDGATSEWSITGDLFLNSSSTATSTLKLANAGKLSATGAVNIGSHGEVKGRGTIAANVNNNGLVAPGASPGTLYVTGNYTQNTSGKLQIELGGTTPDTAYDQLQVTGTVALNGSLQTSLINGFIPTIGSVFDIFDGTISGAFASISLPVLPTTLAWDITSLYTTGLLKVGLKGDFNNNGIVDAADYVVWRNNTGTTNPLPNDNAIGGTVGPAHYTLWRSSFGQGSGTSTGAGQAEAAVPEPTSIFLAISVIASSASRRRRI